MLKLLLIALFLVGCSSEKTDYREVAFIEMEHDKIVLSEHKELCNKRPDSIFCTNAESVGDIMPTKGYALEILQEMNSNFIYRLSDEWIYNNTVYEYLDGDCEDIASTMAQHMIDDGVDPKYLSLVYRLTSETTAHMFLAVETSDWGILHLDYSNSGYPIEAQINFHMKMNNVGIHKWIKGNIKTEGAI